MKQNWFKNGIWPCKGRTWPNKMGLKMTLVIIIALTPLSVPSLFAKKAVLEKVKEQEKRGQMKLETAVDLPRNHQAAAEIKPVTRQQTQVLPASAVQDKGTQIKWHIISSGGNCGSNFVTHRPGGLDGCELCGTIGQVGVGSGSSPSYGINSGFWQEFLQGYIRGDANGDGVINSADVVYLINYLFIDGPAPDPLWVGDANCDDMVNSADVVHLINYLFIEGPPPSC